MARKLRSDEREIFDQALKAAELPSPALEEFFARLIDKSVVPPKLDPAADAWLGEEVPDLPPS
jgi:hypothetical protein